MARAFVNSKVAVEEHVFLVKRFFDQQGDKLGEAADLLVRAFQSGHRVFFFGNGGSAADAQHLAAEFVGRFQHDRPGLPALALTTDTSALTAIGNDYGYESVFARQIEALGQKEDVAVAISTSGRSPNIREGILAARNRGLTTIGLLGGDGGTAKEMVDLALVVDGRKTARVQEVHILVGHLLCEAVETALFERRP
ncbi:MAG TPA: D-sedoheptulose 7-phosphate isomerase [Acidobacteriota bacterium]|nr:D-sedoheptulose 7-phosphate isomerase [Acidobacteriota bacterium]